MFSLNFSAFSSLVQGGLDSFLVACALIRAFGMIFFTCLVGWRLPVDNYTGLSLHFVSKGTWTFSTISFNNCRLPFLCLLVYFPERPCLPFL